MLLQCVLTLLAMSHFKPAMNKMKKRKTSFLLVITKLCGLTIRSAISIIIKNKK